MTAYVAATLQNLLTQRFGARSGPSVPLMQASRPAPPRRWMHGPDAAETLPMLFRSEGFAEDLVESHPCD
jgi:hypothetical protein